MKAWRREASEAYATLDRIANEAPAPARLDAIHAARSLGAVLRKYDRVSDE
jgi:hypothetical protein